ncbi:hypothetical protein [Halovivax limisalsi]|uniref:hypothetical protein n=1 Tax=Halovivax limisalsi TaxID=1453760 RepID=UPI001FFD3C10|nr:hypothetical protein [Halovivax limisalsi]
MSEAATRAPEALAVRYATAGTTDWVGALERADASGTAIPLLEQLYRAADDDVANGSATPPGSWTRPSDLDDATGRYLAAERRRRQARLDQFRLDLALVDDILDGRDVPYAVIKTNVDLPWHPWDVNLLAAERDWSRVDSLLTENGWRRTSFPAHPLARSEPGKRLYEHPVRHPIHLHRDVSWNGLRYVPAEPVLDSRTRIDGVWYPDPTIDAVIHAAHAVFENFAMGLPEAVTIVRHLAGDPGEERADRTSGDRERAIERHRTIERGRHLAAIEGWPTGYDLAVTAAREVIDDVEHRPATVSLPRALPAMELARAWLEHARSPDGGWYELPLNVALRGAKVVSRD